jgi:hypothetical protein
MVQGTPPPLAPVRPSALSRRTIIKGAAWSVPVLMVGAPAAHAGISQCLVNESLTIAPNRTLSVRAICTAQSQSLTPTTINGNYATGNLPPFIEVCNCQNDDAWYVWQETDTLSSFQIEVDGVHIDQNSPNQGWREPFFLRGFGQTGGCRRFNLTYRTSVSRSTTAVNVDITFTFRRWSGSITDTPPGINSPQWQVVPPTPLTRRGTVAANPGETADFSVCSAPSTSGARTRSLAPQTGSEQVAPDPTGD